MERPLGPPRNDDGALVIGDGRGEEDRLYAGSWLAGEKMHWFVVSMFEPVTYLY